MSNRIRYLILIAALALTVQSALAAEPTSYYESALGKSNEALMTSLRNIIRSHKQLSYGALWDAFKTTDTDEQGYIIDMYSNCRYRPDQHGGSSSAVGGGFNREHSFPKSWFDDEYPMYTDLFHLYPTDIKVNGQRSNFPFGVCEKGNRLTNGGLYGKGKLGTSSYPGYSGTVFEPDDEYKGDFARTYFYMVTCYKNELPSWPGSPQLNYTANRYKAFSTWTINMFMEWTRMDPVSEKEIKRNDAVYSIQGNRNPFIDHPELAEYIWGDKQGEVWTGTLDPVNPAIISPVTGTVIDMGSTITGTPLEYTINVKGQGLTRGLSLSLQDNEYFYVNKDSFTASEANSGCSFVITFDADQEGTYSDVITISSDEVSTTVTVIATATQQGVTPPPIAQGDSIMEDWEGCKSGGYWNTQVQGHTWKWDFTDAGIWGDNLKHDQLSCRMGKSSNSAITMAEDVEGGTSAIGLWAGAYGSDADVSLRIDYSTDKGASWKALGNVTFTKGSLQHIVLNADVTGSVRFRIVQTAGTRANIDDITLYGRKQPVPKIRGDVNHDGEVNIADVNATLDIILSGSYDESGDVNIDSEVNVADINAIIAIIQESHKAQ
jgi:endonuclease I